MSVRMVTEIEIVFELDGWDLSGPETKQLRRWVDESLYNSWGWLGACHGGLWR